MDKGFSDYTSKLDDVTADADIDVRTILDMVCGKSGVAFQESKCITTISNIMVEDMDIENAKQIAVYDTAEPVISIQRRGEYVYLNLDFQSISSSAMRQFYMILENFGKIQDQLADHEDSYISNYIMMIPIAFPNVTVSFTNPMFWAMQPPNPSARITQVHLVYLAENVRVLFDDADVDAARKQILEEEKVEIARLDREIFMIEQDVKSEKDEAALKMVDDEYHYDDLDMDEEE